VRVTELCKGKKVEGEKPKMGGKQNIQTGKPVLRYHSRDTSWGKEMGRRS